MRYLPWMALFLVASTAQADGAGLAYFGMAHPRFDCAKAYHTFDGAPEISIAVIGDRTFGDSNDCFRVFAADPRTKHIEIHAINGPGLRNGQLQPEEALYGYNRLSFGRALLNGDGDLRNRLYRHFEMIKARFVDQLQPGTECWISPVLEHDMTVHQWLILTQLGSEVIGGRCKWVYNPLHRTNESMLPAYTEGHGAAPKLAPLCIYNNDGTDITNGKRQLDRYAFCHPRFYWRKCMNGRRNMSKWRAPRNRIGWCNDSDWKAARSAVQ